LYPTSPIDFQQRSKVRHLLNPTLTVAKANSPQKADGMAESNALGPVLMALTTGADIN